MTKPHITTGSVFDDLGFSKAEAENLKIRAALMREVERYVRDHRLTQTQAAKLFKVSQPRLSNLMRGKIGEFTIDMLVNMLARAHMSVTLRVKPKRKAA